MAIDFSKYGSPVATGTAGARDFSKYGIETGEKPIDFNPVQPEGLGTKLYNRAADAVGAPFRPQKFPGQAVLNVAGDVGGAVGDIYGAVLSPIIEKTADVISEVPAVQKLANTKPVSAGLSAVNTDIEQVGATYKKAEEKYPTIVRTVEDVANLLNVVPLGKAKVPKVVKEKLYTREVEGLADEILKVEEKYSPVRKSNQYSKDAPESRLRIAESGVLRNSVDENGLIQTGEAIKTYRSMPITETGLSLDDVDDIVRRSLEAEGKTVNLGEVRNELRTALMDTVGLEGANLASALRSIDKHIQGLSARADELGEVPLYKIQDAKIGETKHIDFNTPSEVKTAKKTIARVYKEVIENKSDIPVKKINQELAPYYSDIERIENLNGKRVEGGRWGKYSAQIVGTGLGMAGGSLAGGTGAFAAGIVGGELASFLKGKSMAGTFKSGFKGKLKQSPTLAQAQANIGTKTNNLKKPDPKVGAPKTVKKTKEIVKLEAKIARNVELQKKAIKAGDFNLVIELKQIYKVLVDQLKKAIKYINEKGSVGLSIKRTVTPESVAKRGDAKDMKFLQRVIDDPDIAVLDPDARALLSQMGLGKATREELVSFAKETINEFKGVAQRPVLKENQANATTPPTKAQSISPTVPPKATLSTPLSTKYYHGTNNPDSIRSRGFSFDKEAQEGSSFLGDNFVEGVYLSKSKTPYMEGGQLEDVVEVLGVSTDAKNILKINSGAELKALYNKYNINELSGDASIKLTNALKKEGYEGAEFMDEVVIFDPKKLKVTPTPERSSALLQEAKKYKSAEEFVKAQPVVYHGSGVPLKKFNNKQGTFFTDDMMNADGYAGGENVYEGYLNLKNPLVIDAKGALHRELDTKWGKTTQEVVGNVDKTKYDGVIFKNIKDSWIDDAEYDTPSTIYYAFKPADAFLNESQLTDIWKEANGK